MHSKNFVLFSLYIILKTGIPKRQNSNDIIHGNYNDLRHVLGKHFGIIIFLLVLLSTLII